MNNNPNIYFDTSKLPSDYYDQLHSSRPIDQEILSRSRPWVLDAGTTFTDNDGVVHTDACGWLAIHAAFHLLYNLKKLPRNLKRRFENHEITPARLKIMSGTIEHNVRISDDDITRIGHALNVWFIIHEPTGVRCRGLLGSYEIDLQYAFSHYSVPLKNHDMVLSREHVKIWADAGYKIINLAGDTKSFNKTDPVETITFPRTSREEYRDVHDRFPRTSNERIQREARNSIDEVIAKHEQVIEDEIYAQQLNSLINGK